MLFSRYSIANNEVSMRLFPNKNPTWQAAYRKGFQRVWVAGASGAFFTAIVRSVPVHFKQWVGSHPTHFRIDMTLRYGYLVWLLCYFFVYNVRFERFADISVRDVWYDVIQSAVSLAAVYVMGFILPDHRYTYQWAYAAFEWSNRADLRVGDHSLSQKPSTGCALAARDWISDLCMFGGPCIHYRAIHCDVPDFYRHGSRTFCPPVCLLPDLHWCTGWPTLGHFDHK